MPLGRAGANDRPVSQNATHPGVGPSPLTGRWTSLNPHRDNVRVGRGPKSIVNSRKELWESAEFGDLPFILAT